MRNTLDRWLGLEGTVFVNADSSFAFSKERELNKMFKGDIWIDCLGKLDASNEIYFYIEGAIGIETSEKDFDNLPDGREMLINLIRDKFQKVGLSMIRFEGETYIDSKETLVERLENWRQWDHHFYIYGDD